MQYDNRRIVIGVFCQLKQRNQMVDAIKSNNIEIYYHATYSNQETQILRVMR